MARRFGQEPRIALLSFSNFGSTRHPLAEKVARAVALVRERAPGPHGGRRNSGGYRPVTPEIIAKDYPFSRLQGGANVLIFPNLEAGNVAYKLVAALAARKRSGRF